MSQTTKIDEILKPSARRNFFSLTDVGNKAIHKQSIVKLFSLKYYDKLLNSLKTMEHMLCPIDFSSKEKNVFFFSHIDSRYIDGLKIGKSKNSINLMFQNL